MSLATTSTLEEVELAGDVVRVRLSGESRLELHRLALRDACPCADCRHPVSGQRLFETSKIVPGARVARTQVDGNALEVIWADGHRSRFDAPWLVREAEAAARGARARRPISLWGSELAAELPAASYEDLLADRGELRRVLAAVAEVGFAVVTGAPVADGTVAEVAELFGHVRVTNYGRVFDVEIKVDATNLADTSLPLGLHTDNPYRSPAPTLQLLQCLVSSANGGDTILADGFRAVSLLRAESPGAAEILARTPVRFTYRDPATELEADVPVVVLDEGGAPRALHVNNRSKGTPVGSPTQVAAWYEAYFELLSILERPDSRVVFRLDPGDVAVFDNLRVLHARTGFSGEGDRRLQGCYADRDGLLSTLAILDAEAVPRWSPS